MSRVDGHNVQLTRISDIHYRRPCILAKRGVHLRSAALLNAFLPILHHRRPGIRLLMDYRPRCKVIHQPITVTKTVKTKRCVKTCRVALRKAALNLFRKASDIIVRMIEMDQITSTDPCDDWRTNNNSILINCMRTIGIYRRRRRRRRRRSRFIYSADWKATAFTI